MEGHERGAEEGTPSFLLQGDDFDVLLCRLTSKGMPSFGLLVDGLPDQYRFPTVPPSTACKLISSFTSCTKAIFPPSTQFPGLGSLAVRA